MEVKAPSHLSAEAAEFFEAIADEYGIDDAAGLRLLRSACESWDRCELARQTLAAEGMFFEDRYGAPRRHPACQVEENSRTAFVRCLRELNLDGDPAPTPRPPVIGARHGTN